MITTPLSTWSLVLLLLCPAWVIGQRMPTFEENAVITLVTGKNSGYAYGAVALGESLRLHGSKMRRIAMVTADVDEESRRLLTLLWELAEVDPIGCLDRSAHFPAGVLPSKEGYPEGLKHDFNRFEKTCTKFHAWTFTEFDRIVFMDSDLVVLSSIDDAVYGYSNASFVAAPECFPPDTINSGFMVFTPSIDTFQFLMDSNENGGSAEGGDQGIYSEYLCPDWFFSDRTDKDCGKLPWKYNVEAQYYVLYKNYLSLYKLGQMKVIHYINDGKPWKTLFYDYNIDTVPRTTMIDQLSAESYVESHMYWRYLFLRATGLPPPPRSIYYDQWDDVITRRGIFNRLDLPLFVGDKNEYGSLVTDRAEATRNSGNDHEQSDRHRYENKRNSRQRRVDVSGNGNIDYMETETAQNGVKTKSRKSRPRMGSRSFDSNKGAGSTRTVDVEDVSDGGSLLRRTSKKVGESKKLKRRRAKNHLSK